MRRKLLLAVVMIAILPAGVQNAFAVASVRIVSFGTDKDIYHLGEKMNISLVLYAQREINNVSVSVKGMKSRAGSNLISLSRSVNLSAGENEITFESSVPRCGCAVTYGNKFINATVAYEGEILNATHGFAITPRGHGQTTYVSIFADEVKRMIDAEDIILLDIRAEEEYKAAHIDDAICIPLSELKNQSGLDELDKSKKIVVYGESGEDSAEACSILIQKDFKKVYNMLGGLKAWQQNGFPVSASSTSTSGFEAFIAFAAFAFALLFSRKSGRGGEGGRGVKGGKNSKNK